MAHGQYQVAVLMSQIRTGVKGHFPRGTVSEGVAEETALARKGYCAYVTSAVIPQNESEMKSKGPGNLLGVH